MAFTVASYNVLADAYVLPERYPGVPEAVLAIAARKPVLLSRVADLGADVVCLQEVEQDVFQALARHLQPLGYQGLFARKTGNKPDGCAAFLRGDDFHLRARHILHYEDGPDTGPPSDYVALFLVLEHQGRPLGVATTHLKWDPPGTPPEDQRGLRQVSQFLAERERLAGDCPSWVLCGDFNVPADSPIIAAVRRAGFRDAYQDRDQATFSRSGEVKRIDFLFHTPDLAARPADLPPLGARTLLPSAQEPSDHLPILARFDWLGR